MAANTFLTPVTIARASLGLLARQLILPATVYRDVEADFVMGTGSVVSIRKPATLTGGGARTYAQAARDAGTELVFDNAAETVVNITIGPMLYKGVKVTDEDLTMNLIDFGQQVLAPQVQIVAEGADLMLSTEMETLADGPEIAADGSDVHEQIIEARRLLNDKHVPFANRWLAVSGEVEALLLNDAQNRLVRVDASGTDIALREAIVGRLYGFNVFVANSLSEGVAIAYHRDAFAMVLRAPASPLGATFSESVAYQGVALRYLRDYDPRFAQDRSLVSVFPGVETLDADRAVKLTTAAA